MFGTKTRNSSPSDPARSVSEPQIAERAYSRWLERGCPVSDGREDWFAARAELERETHPPTVRTAKNALRFLPATSRTL
jgi:hypothetical protein